MEYLSRSRLPVFTPRLDLTAEDLNAEAETLCAAINELAGRLFIIKDMIPKEERAQYAEEESYPILDEIERIWEDIQRAWETIEQNKEECEEHYEETMNRITELDERLNTLIQAVKQELLDVIDAVDKKHDDEEERIENKFDISFADLEKRFNALDDAAARKADLATLFDRIQYIQDNSLPKIGADGYWYIGKIRTNTLARGPQGEKGETGDSGVYIGENAPTNGANVWIDPTGEGEDTPVDYGIGWGITKMEAGDISGHEEEYFAKYGAIITRLPLPEVITQMDTAPAENFVVDHRFENDIHLETSFDVATKTITATMTNIADYDQYFSGLMVRDSNWYKSFWMGPQKTVKPGKSVTTTLVLASEDYVHLTENIVMYTVQYCEPLNDDNSREVVLIGGTEVLTNSSNDNAKHLLYPSYVEDGQWFDPKHKLVCVHAMGTEAKPENIIKVILMGKEIAFKTDIPNLNDYALKSEIPDTYNKSELDIKFDDLQNQIGVINTQLEEIINGGA